MLIVVLLGTGIRRTECINLKWTDFDVENSTLVVYGKSRRSETIFITEKLVKELAAYKLFCQRYFTTKSDYIFVMRDGKQLTQNSIMLVFQNLQKKMSFSDVRVSPHTFRHTFCHRLAMSGNELKEENDKHNPLNNLDL